MDNDLATLEQQIDNAERHAWLVKARAIKTIRDGRLYKEQYKNFASYVKDRFRWSISYAKKLVLAAQASESVNLESVANEGQARQIIEAPENLRPALVQLLGILPDKPTAKSIGILTEVLQEAISTGAIELGDDGQLPIAEAMRYSVTEAVFERYQRQLQHIKDRQSSELVLELVKTPAGQVELLDVLYTYFASNTLLDVKVYRKENGITIVIRRNNETT